MFMQLWIPTVIHLSLSKTYRLKKPDPQQQMYPQRNLLECFFKMVEPTKSLASLPYIKGVTEPLTYILKKHAVSVVNKPFTTLQQQFPAPKFRPLMESQTNVVYKTPRTNCSWCYIWETGRAFNSRKKRTFEKHQNCGQRF